jgi:hypothetical protein
MVDQSIGRAEVFGIEKCLQKVQEGEQTYQDSEDVERQSIRGSREQLSQLDQRACESVAGQPRGQLSNYWLLDRVRVISHWFLSRLERGGIQAGTQSAKPTIY